jgi:hypothetical protein
VQGHERHLDFVIAQLVDDRPIYIQSDGIISTTRKRMMNGLPGSKRDLPLSRLPTHKHTNPSPREQTG